MTSFTTGSTQSVPFAECLFVRVQHAKMSPLDRVVVYVVFLLVAMAMAEDTRRQQLFYQLRCVVLPLSIVPAEVAPGGILRWLVTPLVVLNEFVSCLCVPVVPFGVVFLMLTQGTNAASALLNGLAMGFLTKTDAYVPQIFLSPATLGAMRRYFIGVASREM